jgi:hypothetical protein
MSEPRPPPAAPIVGDIPQAAGLHTQLDVLLRAIDALRNGGALSTVGVLPPREPGATAWTGMPVATALNPPVDDAEAMKNLAAALTEQALVIAEQLAAMGYEADVILQKLRE